MKTHNILSIDKFKTNIGRKNITRAKIIRVTIAAINFITIESLFFDYLILFDIAYI